MISHVELLNAAHLVNLARLLFNSHDSGERQVMGGGEMLESELSMSASFLRVVRCPTHSPLTSGGKGNAMTDDSMVAPTFSVSWSLFLRSDGIVHS